MPDTDVFDLDAAAAEVERHPYPFRWDGQDWLLANAFLLDLRIITKATDGDIDVIWAALRQALDLGEPGQADRFETVRKPLGVDAARILFTQWVAAAGMEAGEPSASSGSSPSTEGPSKRTSTGSTASASRKPSSRRPRKTATASAS